MGIAQYFISPLVALITAPLMIGIIRKTKAFFAGRKGTPLLQMYYSLYRLFQKDSVISGTTSYIFKIAPVIILTTTIAATAFLPFLSSFNYSSFTGDFILMFYLLGVARFFIIISSLDTGSAFEGMGASREALFSALAEPVMFISIITFLRLNNSFSFSASFANNFTSNWIILTMLAIPVFIVLLVENSRIPFDDPTTHLELTMIHEVMILDNSGVDLGILEYAASIKLWFFSMILIKFILPVSQLNLTCEIVLTFGLLILISILIGIVESTIARCRLLKTPQLLFSAGVVSFLAFFLTVTKLFKW